MGIINIEKTKGILEFARLIEQAQSRGLITADERAGCDSAIKAKLKAELKKVTNEIE